jgi:hypothetical protein
MFRRKTDHYRARLLVAAVVLLTIGVLLGCVLAALVLTPTLGG